MILRYAEFYRVEGNRIAETALCRDVLSIMDQAGHYPLPQMTGTAFTQVLALMTVYFR
jgi:hypothetical protein